MKYNYLGLDTEFNKTHCKDYNVLAACFSDGREENAKFWLGDVDHKNFNNYLNGLKVVKDTVLVSHNVVAEARALLSLGINPLDFKWIDTFIEFRCLTNHNDKLKYGEHLIDGIVKILKRPPPKYMQNENERREKGSVTHSYSQAVYKFLNIIIDTERKEEIRNLIISDPLGFSRQEKQEILDYCFDDTRHLVPMLRKMVGHYKQLLRHNFDKTSLISEMLWRGECQVRTAMMEYAGYPIDYNATKNFSTQVPQILRDIQKDINKQFPDIKPFHLDPKTRLFKMKQKPIKDWIKKSVFRDRWLLTANGDYSLSLDAFADHFHAKHSYKRGCFGSQMLRYLKTKQSLNGFMPRGDNKRKTFWDYVSPDKIVRPYLNAYGAQSSRFQPSATGFIFLKSAWMRSLVVPPKGKMIVGSDFKSEEYLLSAIKALDKAMYKAYLTGDVYLAFGHDSGVMKKTWTKKSHPVMRQACKNTVLGISYLMTKIGLAKKLTQDAGKEYTEEEAQDYIDKFFDTYPDFAQDIEDRINAYYNNKFIKLPDGWYMWGNNPNERSVGNVEIQGLGACILRKSVQLCQDAGLEVIIPLHDALYILADINDWEAVDTFNRCMKEAFCFYFEGQQRKWAESIMLDTEAWSPELKEGEIITAGGNKVKVEKIHIDERAEEEYKTFNRYFSTPDSVFL